MRPGPRLLIGTIGLLIAPFVRSAADASPPPITDFSGYWAAERPPESERSHPLRMDGVVLYHDTGWRSMWLRCGDTTGYLGFAGDVPKVEPGQRVLIEGDYHPATNRLIANPRLTFLDGRASIEIVDARGRMAQAESLHTRVITIEGLVDRQVEKDANHLMLEVVVEGRLVTFWIPHNAPGRVPQFADAIVRATGLFCATPNPSGQLTRLELCVDDLRFMEIVGRLDRDPRFSTRPVPIQDIARTPGDQLVHIVGIARATEPGQSVTLRDDTGQVTVLSPQTAPVKLGERLEAIGYPSAAGAETKLRDAVLRPAQQIAPSLRHLPSLRLAAQIRELLLPEAASSYPVHVSGAVTWSHPDSEYFFLLDASGGICVRRPADDTLAPQVGEKVEVVGATEAGQFAPVVRASGLHRAGYMDLPEPPLVSHEQALTGADEAQWVTMIGFVREAENESLWLRLELGSPAGAFTALLPGDAPITGLRGAVVRLRGVCNATADAQRRFSGIRLLVPTAASLTIEEPCPPDPFDAPERSIASLRLFGSLPATNRRVRVTGIVTAHAPGRVLHVQDGADCLIALGRDTTPLSPGDRVEIVGFPRREGIRVVLHEAVFRRIDSRAEPPPLELASLRPIDPLADGRLAHVQGRLLEISPQESGTRLSLQNATGLLEASLERGRDSIPAGAEPGSTLVLTGIYRVRMDEYNHPASAVLLLRAPSDIVVLRRPSWWTVRRALGASAVLALGTVLGLAWGVALRRRVSQQTRLIREQFEKEKAARFEATQIRASKLESLGLLAGGIAHDFNNLLTVVICNLSLLRLGRRFEPDVEQCILDSTRASLRARELTLQLLTFSKGGAPVLTAVSLPEIVRESGEFARHGSSVRCVYDFALEIWPAQADKAQIGQVVHNLVLNAVQAMPGGGVVIIALRNETLADRVVADLPGGRYVQLTIADQGTGIPPEVLPRIFEPYYTTKQTGNGLGLATVHSIVRRHGGQIEVASSLGKGTTFTLWLPAANDASRIGETAADATPPRLSGRILFMDDEEPIRRTAGLLFRHLGLDAVLVADGAAAVDEFAAARAAGAPFAAVILDLTVPGGMGGTHWGVERQFGAAKHSSTRQPSTARAGDAAS
ncbi:MAG TPA: ATP-binding protein, partial [Opitutaceae bacterium]|nr:ATP-binding protein [Opitutaceae bacterium]